MNITEQPLTDNVQRLKKGSIADVEQLYAAVYGTVPAQDFFEKKYDTMFTGVENVGFIAYNDNGFPIAFYAVIPCFIRFEEKIVLAAQSADTMTHPDYRFKGLFVDLARRTFDLCESLGIRLVFGFPNQHSLPGFINKLGWQMTGRMDCFRIQVSSLPWRRYLGKLPFLKKTTQKRRKKLLECITADRSNAPDSVCEGGFAGTYRDPDFLLYKTYTENRVIRIGNSILWIKINDVLLIGDAGVKAEDLTAMMHQLKKLAAKLGVNEVQFHASPGTALHHLFAGRYPVVPSFPVIFKDLGAGLQLKKIKFTSADIDTF